jgi:ubiquinone/menaquinone biosynthesis C-methylase UbiE
VSQDWYKTAFGRAYADLYAHRNREDARQAVDFLYSRSDLRPLPGRRVLDLCCGGGRHSLEILERGAVCCVVGLDLSNELLLQAQEAARETARAPAWVRGDMRSLPFLDGTFRLAINLFTSFGYFLNEADNDRVLADVARVLEPGAGRFVLDHMNPAWLRGNLKPETLRVTAHGARVRERRAIDETRRRVEKRIEVEANGARRESLETVRFYETPELEEKAARTGMRLRSAFGGFDASPLTASSPRALYVFAKG